MGYECHITVNVEYAEIAKKFVEEVGSDGGNVSKGLQLKWKHSEIARDPLLGDKNFFYLTCHDTDVERIFVRMRYATKWLQEQNVPVLREKVELIIYDRRIG